METTNRISITCCSDPRKEDERDELERLKKCLKGIGLEAVCSPFIFEEGTAREKAEYLTQCFTQSGTGAIFDISGGDAANQLLPFLDYEAISASKKTFWGYSDLTTILNAIYAKTGKKSILYQIRNIVEDPSGRQLDDFCGFYFKNEAALTGFPCSFIQGCGMDGILCGGNVRCLLKLAGTPYFPDMDGKILLLEALHGRKELLESFFSQLDQMGVFNRVGGVLLGTFTEMDGKGLSGMVYDMVREHLKPDVPLAATRCIGHQSTSKAVIIGGHITLQGNAL